MPRKRADKTSLWVNLSSAELKTIDKMGKRIRSSASLPSPLTAANVIRIALRRTALGHLAMSLPDDVFAIVPTGRPKRTTAA
jgi:hypothetical protein